MGLMTKDEYDEVSQKALDLFAFGQVNVIIISFLLITWFLFIVFSHKTKRC